ncbi:MAG: ferritin-like domain-containing protein [Fimbriimonas sp.]
MKLTETISSRRSLLQLAGGTALGVLGSQLLLGCGGSGTDTNYATALDQSILGAAKIAEALAVTMYTGIINDAPFFATLSAANQGYIRAARDEEKFHYDLLRNATGGADAQLNYYFPTNMFSNIGVTINTLTTLEDAFIAAYLVGVKDLSTPDLRVLAAKIMGIESDHRTLARLIGDDLGLTTITGLSGSPEPVDPPNNNVYERTYGLTTISQVVSALGPFLALGSNTVLKTFNPAYVPSNTDLYPNPAN